MGSTWSCTFLLSFFLFCHLKASYFTVVVSFKPFVHINERKHLKFIRGLRMCACYYAALLLFFSSIAPLFLNRTGVMFLQMQTTAVSCLKKKINGVPWLWSSHRLDDCHRSSQFVTSSGLITVQRNFSSGNGARKSCLKKVWQHVNPEVL